MKQTRHRRKQGIRLLLLLIALFFVCIGILLQERNSAPKVAEPTDGAEPPSPTISVQDQEEPVPSPDAGKDTFISVTPVPTPPIPTQLEETKSENELLIEQILADMSLKEKIGQLFLARCPDTKDAALKDLSDYSFGGYVFFANHFEQETPESIRSLLVSYQEAASIPMLFGVDEEGGTVTRVSRFPAFREKRFDSPQNLYQKGGMETVIADTKEKSKFLLNLGLNLNLAPVCDVSQNASDYMYARSFGRSAEETAEYAGEVVAAMKESKIGSVLKHFPGYGNNNNTHDGIAIDKREYSQFETVDFLPFQAGIEAGADAILISHTIVEAIDPEKPASLSKEVHRIVREVLGFNGVIMTDDLIMQAITEYTESAVAAVDAVKAGNDMLIASDYQVQFTAVLEAVNAGEISVERIEESVRRILNWKLELGLLKERS